MVSQIFRWQRLLRLESQYKVGLAFFITFECSTLIAERFENVGQLFFAVEDLTDEWEEEIWWKETRQIVHFDAF